MIFYMIRNALLRWFNLVPHLQYQLLLEKHCKLLNDLDNIKEVLGECSKQEDQIMAYGCSKVLVSCVLEAGAVQAVLIQEGVTYEDTPVGDWEIVVRQIKPA
jgi:hypothetical protein